MYNRKPKLSSEDQKIEAILDNTFPSLSNIFRKLGRGQIQEAIILNRGLGKIAAPAARPTEKNLGVIKEVFINAIDQFLEYAYKNFPKEMLSIYEQRSAFKKSHSSRPKDVDAPLICAGLGTHHSGNPDEPYHILLAPAGTRAEGTASNEVFELLGKIIRQFEESKSNDKVNVVYHRIAPPPNQHSVQAEWTFLSAFANRALLKDEKLWDAEYQSKSCGERRMYLVSAALQMKYNFRLEITVSFPFMPHKQIKNSRREDEEKSKEVLTDSLAMTGLCPWCGAFASQHIGDKLLSCAEKVRMYEGEQNVSLRDFSEFYCAQSSFPEYAENQFHFKTQEKLWPALRAQYEAPHSQDYVNYNKAENRQACYSRLNTLLCAAEDKESKSDKSLISLERVKFLLSASEMFLEKTLNRNPTFYGLDKDQAIKIMALILAPNRRGRTILQEALLSFSYPAFYKLIAELRVIFKDLFGANTADEPFKRYINSVFYSDYTVVPVIETAVKNLARTKMYRGGAVRALLTSFSHQPGVLYDFATKKIFYGRKTLIEIFLESQNESGSGENLLAIAKELLSTLHERNYEHKFDIEKMLFPQYNDDASADFLPCKDFPIWIPHNEITISNKIKNASLDSILFKALRGELANHWRICNIFEFIEFCITDGNCFVSMEQYVNIVKRLKNLVETGEYEKQPIAVNLDVLKELIKRKTRLKNRDYENYCTLVLPLFNEIAKWIEKISSPVSSVVEEKKGAPSPSAKSTTPAAHRAKSGSLSSSASPASNPFTLLSASTGGSMKPPKEKTPATSSLAPSQPPAPVEHKDDAFFEGNQNKKKKRKKPKESFSASSAENGVTSLVKVEEVAVEAEPSKGAGKSSCERLLSCTVS